MKYIFCLVVLISSFRASSQSNYIKGYYVSTSGDTIKGYIQNKNWLVSPSKFNFRKSLNDSETEILVSGATMFAMGNNEIYLAKQFYYREIPDVTFLKKEELLKYDSLDANVFVRVLIKGKMNLLKFVSETTTAHYIIVTEQKEEFLIYEKYRMYSDTTAGNIIYEVENIQYKRQLKKAMKDAQQLFTKIDNLDYADKQLLKTITAYNLTSGGKSETLTNRSDKMKLYIRPSIGVPVYSGQSINNLFSASAGIDFVLPRNSEKLAFYVDLCYRSFTTSTLYRNIFGSDTNNIEKINSLVVSGGIRQYFFNSRKLMPYIYGGGHLWYSDKKNVRNYFGGIGISYKKRLEIDMSYNNRLSNTDTRNKYHFVLLTLAYRIPIVSYASSN